MNILEITNAPIDPAVKGNIKLLKSIDAFIKGDNPMVEKIAAIEKLDLTMQDTGERAVTESDVKAYLRGVTGDDIKAFLS
jgi:hypothetical protein